MTERSSLLQKVQNARRNAIRLGPELVGRVTGQCPNAMSRRAEIGFRGRMAHDGTTGTPLA
jgi:hypothetical protein